MVSPRARRGLSNAVSALILIIASVMLTLVVVGYAFGLIGAFVGTPQVMQVGTGSITTSGQAIFMLHSTGDVQIVDVQIAGTSNYATSVSPQTLSAGVNTITASFRNVDVMPGATYSLVVVLANGETVPVVVIGE